MVEHVWQYIILAVIQGFTEVFPVSSSGHLVVAGNLLGQEMSFDKILLFHFGTFLAILYFYRNDIMNILKGNLGWKVPGFMLISFVTTALVGFVVTETLVASLSQRPQYVAVLWLLNGLIVAVIGVLSGSGFKHMSDLSIREYIIIGVVQGVAAVPGISRLGLTLGIGLLRKMTWFEALKLSFLLSLPTIFAANLFKFLQYFNIGPSEALFLQTQNSSMASEVVTANLNWPQVMMVFLITLTTLGCCLIALRFMTRFLGRRLLFYFGCYSMIAGIFFSLYFGLL